MKFFPALCLTFLVALPCQAVEETKEITLPVKKLFKDGKCEHGKYSVAPSGEPQWFDDDQCAKATCGEDLVLRVQTCYNGDEEGMCFDGDPDFVSRSFPWCCTKRRIDCVKKDFGFNGIAKLNADGSCQRFGLMVMPNQTVYDLERCTYMKCWGSEETGWFIRGGWCYTGREDGLCFEDIEPTGDEYPRCCTKKLARCPNGKWKQWK